MYYVYEYSEYPIYEPAEGGYYYSGVNHHNVRSYKEWKKAKKAFLKMRKEFNEYVNDFHEPSRVIEYISQPCMMCHYDAKYIGDGFGIALSKKEPVDRGWEPYC